MTATAATAPARTATAYHRTLLVLQVLLAAFLLIASAAPKFAGQKDAVESFTKIGWGQWFRYVTGTCEAAGAIGLLIPRLAGLAATALIGLMIGATLAQLLVLGPANAPFPLVFGVIFALIAWHRRTETKSLLHQLKP